MKVNFYINKYDKHDNFTCIEYTNPIWGKRYILNEALNNYSIFGLLFFSLLTVEPEYLNVCTQLEKLNDKENI